MATEQHTINIVDIPALQPVAEQVTRTRQRQRLSVDGANIVIIVEPSTTKPVPRTRKKRSSDSFLASYRAIPPLSRPLSVEEMTDIAAEEHAQEAAVRGL